MCTISWITYNSRIRDGSATLPTRLIDVSVDSAGTVYSVKGSDIDQGANYIALSHCWGSGYTYNLQTNDKDALADGISIALLPGSFRNATVVVRDLGQQYLWIDSLCIIQDSLIDWKQESEKMAAIYRNALFNAAADRATSDEEGFLSRRRLTSERQKHGVLHKKCILACLYRMEVIRATIVFMSHQSHRFTDERGYYKSNNSPGDSYPLQVAWRGGTVILCTLPKLDFRLHMSTTTST